MLRPNHLGYSPSRRIEHMVQTGQIVQFEKAHAEILKPAVLHTSTGIRGKDYVTPVKVWGV